MITEAIDFRFLLLEQYKKLGLNETELAVVFMIDHLIDSGNPFVTADLLFLKMSLDVKELDNILAVLLTKGLLEYKTLNGKTVTSLNPLKDKLFREFQITMSKENEDNHNQKVKEELSNIYHEFEKLLERSLSPVEISKIREWVEFGYSDETIINALKEALSQNKKSFRTVDKILLNWSNREDIESEGIATIDNNWKKNLAETIRIAKTPWIDQDDDDQD